MREEEAGRPINTWAAWRPFLKPLARVLVLAQVALALQPLSVLAQEKGQAPYNPVAQAQLQRLAQLNQSIEQAKANRSKTPADAVSDKLARAQELVAQLRSAYSSNNSGKHQQLTTLWKEITAGAAEIRAEFAATRADLERKNASAELLARHDEAVARFEHRSIAFAAIANGAGTANEKLEQLNTYFGNFPSKKKHAPFDPRQLPWGTAKPVPRLPAESRTAWFQNLHKTAKIQLAQAGGVMVGGVQFNMPPEPGQAPRHEDLAPTADVELTPAIRAKARELGYNPVNIYNWVYNNVKWLPTWGSIQGADGTLKSLQGNAFDTTSLAIGLLRASGIPARYQFGTIEVPAAQAMNWVGGVEKPESALNLLYMGGIAARVITSGGQLRSIRMEHVWVNAYVNWSPSRGAREGGNGANPPVLAPHGQPQHPNPNPLQNQWVPLDASFKQYTYTRGLNIPANVPFDGDALLQVAQGGTVSEKYVQNLDTGNLQAQLASYQERLKNYIAASPSGATATVATVFGDQTIRTRNLSLLPGVEPNAVVVRGGEHAELPDVMRWKVQLRLYQTESDRAADSSSITFERSLASLSGRRVSVAYEPATAADQDVIDSAAANGQTSFAAYLVRYVPKLKVDAEVLGTGYAQQPGTDGQLNVVMQGPLGDNISSDYRFTSGDTAVVSLNAAGVPVGRFTAHLSEVSLEALSDSPGSMQAMAEEMLHQLGLAWWAEKFAGQENIAAQLDVVQCALPSHALLLAPISIRYAFGVPRNATYKSRVIDGKMDRLVVESRSGQDAVRTHFTRAAGKLGSYLEGAVFDQAFNFFAPKGISTISLIGQAHAEGQRIYTLKLGDEQLVGELGIGADVRDEILQSLSLGRTVSISERDTHLAGYTGVGYIIEDPMDASAAYQIDGGRSGGSSPAAENVLPIPQMPNTNLIGILLGRQLKNASAQVAVENGMIVGLVLPAVPVELPGLGALIAVLVLLLLISKGLSNTADQTYPRQSPPRRFRHYTDAQAAILQSHSLLFSESGLTMGGNGVYVADAEDEERRGVTCSSMDPLDIVTRFQIPPPPDTPDPTLVTGFVEITEDLKGWLQYESVVNPVGQIEYIIRRPWTYVVNPIRGPEQPLFKKALILVPFGPVSITGACPP